MRFGIDLGGTKIELIALDESGVPVLRRRIGTPKDSYAEIIAGIRGLVQSAEVQLGVRGTVGVGTPGALSPKTGALRNSNTAVLNGRAIREDLSAALGRPVRIENDANCFALSEAVDGAGAGADVVFGVIIGTGTGGGLVVGRRLVTGPNAIAGEWGHNPLPWPQAQELPGPRCYCGQTGCIETFVSGPGFAADYQRQTKLQRTAQEVMQRIEQGEVAASEAFARYVDRLARAICSIINVLDPDVIVLGGGMSNVRRLYDELPRLLPRHVFADEFSTPIVPAVHGDSSGVRGAAWLWPPSSKAPPGERGQ